MESEKIRELENEIAELKAQISILKPTSVSPTTAMREIRQKYREQYFGTWEEMRTGHTAFGPNGKSHSDYSAITDIITKTTGILFKYSYGKANGEVQIQSLISTKDDLKRYDKTCKEVCKSLREQIDHIN